MPLVLALSALTILATLGGSLVLGSSTEATIAGRYRDGVVAFYAAEGALEGAVARLRQQLDWSAVVEPGNGAWQASEPSVWLRDAGDGMVGVRAEGRGPGGARRTLEAVVARSGPGVRLVLWRERR